MNRISGLCFAPTWVAIYIDFLHSKCIVYLWSSTLSLTQRLNSHIAVCNISIHFTCFQYCHHACMLQLARINRLGQNPKNVTVYQYPSARNKHVILFKLSLLLATIQLQLWLLDKDAYMVMHTVQVGYITRFSIFVTYTATGTMDTGVQRVIQDFQRQQMYIINCEDTCTL